MIGGDAIRNIYIFHIESDDKERENMFFASF